MSWDELNKAIRNKITKNVYFLQKIKSFLPVNARKLFVNSYILPHILLLCCMGKLFNNTSNLSVKNLPLFFIILTIKKIVYIIYNIYIMYNKNNWLFW